MRFWRNAIAAVVVMVLLAGAARPNSADSGSERTVLEAYVRAWNQHDSAAFDTLLAPDGVHEDLAQGFTGRGSAQVKDFMRELLKLEPNVAAEWRWTATYTGPGPSGPLANRRIAGRGASVAVISRGRITRFTDYYDAASFFSPLSADSTRR
jgi:ketosteroid isomerase-like protein